MRALVAPGRDTEAAAHVRAREGSPGDALGVDLSPELSALHIALLRGRWRAVNAPHFVALVRAGARFEAGKLVERPEEDAPPSPASSDRAVRESRAIALRDLPGRGASAAR